MTDLYGLSRQDVDTLREIKRRSNQTPFGPQQRRGRWPANVQERTRHYRITAKNCLVDGATIYKGSSGEVFPAEFNGGTSGLEHNYVIARPCNERGILRGTEDVDPEELAQDTVLVCLSAAFRGVVARDLVITAQPFVMPPQIDVGISRCVIAVTGGLSDIVGIGTDPVLGFAENIILFRDRSPNYDGTDTEVTVPFANLYGDPVPVESQVAVVWELVPEFRGMSGNLSFRSRLRMTDYGCPDPQIEEED